MFQKRVNQGRKDIHLKPEEKRRYGLGLKGLTRTILLKMYVQSDRVRESGSNLKMPFLKQHVRKQHKNSRQIMHMTWSSKISTKRDLRRGEHLCLVSRIWYSKPHNSSLSPDDRNALRKRSAWLSLEMDRMQLAQGIDSRKTKHTRLVLKRT